jgi:hypothetical protein
MNFPGKLKTIENSRMHWVLSIYIGLLQGTLVRDAGLGHNETKLRIAPRWG